MLISSPSSSSTPTMAPAVSGTPVLDQQATSMPMMPPPVVVSGTSTASSSGISSTPSNSMAGIKIPHPQVSVGVAATTCIAMPNPLLVGSGHQSPMPPGVVISTPAGSAAVGSPTSAGSGSGGAASKSFRLCRHFLRGRCTWGNGCRFSHDPERAAAEANSNEGSVAPTPKVSSPTYLGPTPTVSLGVAPMMGIGVGGGGNGVHPQQHAPAHPPTSYVGFNGAPSGGMQVQGLQHPHMQHTPTGHQPTPVVGHNPGGSMAMPSMHAAAPSLNQQQGWIGMQQAQLQQQRHAILRAAMEGQFVVRPTVGQNGSHSVHLTTLPSPEIIIQLLSEAQLRVQLQQLEMDERVREGGLHYIIGEPSVFWSMIRHWNQTGTTTHPKWDMQLYRARTTHVVECMFFRSVASCLNPSCPFEHIPRSGQAPPVMSMATSNAELQRVPSLGFGGSSERLSELVQQHHMGAHQLHPHAAQHHAAAFAQQLQHQQYHQHAQPNAVHVSRPTSTPFTQQPPSGGSVMPPSGGNVHHPQLVQHQQHQQQQAHHQTQHDQSQQGQTLMFASGPSIEELALAATAGGHTHAHAQHITTATRSTGSLTSNHSNNISSQSELMWQPSAVQLHQQTLANQSQHAPAGSTSSHVSLSHGVLSSSLQSFSQQQQQADSLTRDDSNSCEPAEEPQLSKALWNMLSDSHQPVAVTTVPSSGSHSIW